MNILLVEDDALLGESAQIGLSQRDFSVNWVTSMALASQHLHESEFECILLDLSLPDGDGLSFLQGLRTRGDDVPVIIITARHAVKDRVRGLELGADDYIVKPYSLDEVAARTRAVIRRWEGRSSNLLQANGICLDPEMGRVTLNDEEIPLSATEMKLLTAFMQNAGRIRTREQLQRAFSDKEGAIQGSNALDVHIHHLRKKLGSETIKTVRGLGYMLMKDEA